MSDEHADDPTLDPELAGGFDAQADAEVAGWLADYASAPTPPMPAAVAARLDAAIAAEVAARAATASAGTATVLPLDAARERRRRSVPTWAGVAAGVAAVALGAALFGGQLGLGDSQDGTGIAAGDAPQDSAGAPQVEAAAQAATASGTAYTTAAFPAQVASLVADGQAPRTTASPSPTAGQAYTPPPAPSAADFAAADALVRNKTALVLCLRSVADTALVLAVDAGTFDGDPAVVAALEVGDEPRLMDVYVVGPDCSPADEHLLRYARLPRP